MNQFSKDILVEQTTIQYIKEIWNDESCHINAFISIEDTIMYP